MTSLEFQKTPVRPQATLRPSSNGLQTQFHYGFLTAPERRMNNRDPTARVTKASLLDIQTEGIRHMPDSHHPLGLLVPALIQIRWATGYLVLISEEIILGQ